MLKLLAQTTTIKVLDTVHTERAYSNQEIADANEIAAQNVSRSIKELEFHEIVKRTEKRKYLLTERGKHLLHKIDDTFQDYYDEL